MISLRGRLHRPKMPDGLKEWMLDMLFVLTHDRKSFVSALFILAIPLGIVTVGVGLPPELPELVYLWYVMTTQIGLGIAVMIVLTIWRRSRMTIIEIIPVEGLRTTSLPLRDAWRWPDDFWWSTEKGKALIVADYRVGEGEPSPKSYDPYGWATKESIDSAEVFELLNFWEAEALYATRSGRLIPVTLTAMVAALGVMGLVFFVQIQELVGR